MSNTLRTKIITPDHGVMFQEEIEKILILTNEGYVSLQHNIMPMVCRVFPGPVKIHLTDGSEKTGYCTGGVIYHDNMSSTKLMATHFEWTNENHTIESVTAKINELEKELEGLTPSTKDFIIVKDKLETNKLLLKALKPF